MYAWHVARQQLTLSAARRLSESFGSWDAMPGGARSCREPGNVCLA